MNDVATLQLIAHFAHAAALALALAGICWAAILAGLSRLHWFWRLSLLCVPLMMLLPIRAYEPLVMLAPLMIVLAVTAARLRGRWEESLGRKPAPRDTSVKPRRATNRWRFSLGDSLLVTTLISVLLAVFVQLPWGNLNFSWLGLCFDGSLFYVLSISCLGIVGLNRGTVWAVVLFGGVFFGIVFETTWGDGLRALYLFGLDGPQQMNWTPLAIFFLAFVTLLNMALWLTRWCSLAQLRPAEFAQRRRFVGSLVMVTAAPGIVLYMAMFIGPAAVPGPSIRNNSLPQLVDVARRIDNLGLGEMTLREVQRTYPESNYDRQIEALYDESMRVVLRPGCVSLDISRQANEDSLPAQEAQLNVLRALARRWSREADHAFRSGDIRRATEYNLAVLRMGNLLSRGGIRIHVQAAAGIKSVGLSHLAMLREHLPLDLVPGVIGVLEALDAGEESPQLTNARDRYWTDIAHGWRHRLETVVQRSLRLPTTETAAFQALKQPLAREAAHRRLLSTELALRHFHQEHGKYPATLAALVPTRLALLPVDPFTQQVLVYRPLTHSFVLYSTGPDARDDGGKFPRVTFENAAFLGQDWSLEALMRNGWRPNRRDLSFGQAPRTGPPPGPAGWTVPPWERDLRSPRGPTEAASVSGNNGTDAVSPSAGENVDNARPRQPREEVRRVDRIPSPALQRSFDLRMRGRRDGR